MSITKPRRTFPKGTPLLTDQQAAERAACSVSTIRRLRRAGVLPTTMIGAAVRVPQAALDELPGRVHDRRRAASNVQDLRDPRLTNGVPEVGTRRRARAERGRRPRVLPPTAHAAAEAAPPGPPRPTVLRTQVSLGSEMTNSSSCATRSNHRT